MSPSRSRVVIIGGNFAGLVAASRISCDHDVTVVDARADFEWTPNIHELLSGVKNREGVVLPRGESVNRYGHTFVQDVVTGIDRDSSSVVTESGLALPYDACLIAAGSVRRVTTRSARKTSAHGGILVFAVKLTVDCDSPLPLWRRITPLQGLSAQHISKSAAGSAHSTH